MIKCVRTLTGLNRKEAVDFVDSAPKPLLVRVDIEIAETSKARLEAAGAAANVRLRPGTRCLIFADMAWRPDVRRPPREPAIESGKREAGYKDAHHLGAHHTREPARVISARVSIRLRERGADLDTDVAAPDQQHNGQHRRGDVTCPRFVAVRCAASPHHNLARVAWGCDPPGHR